MRSLQDWLSSARRVTKHSDPKAPDIIARKTLRLTQEQLLTSTKTLTQKEHRKMQNLLGKVLRGKNLYQTLGSTTFHGVNLKLNSKVLTPRAETESLVEFCIKKLPKEAKVLEVGTGSGAIGLALYKARPDIKITLTDISKHQLRIAKNNARLNKLLNHKDRLNFQKSNLLKNIANSELKESFLVANLPYLNPLWPHVSTQKLKSEPRSALYSGKNGIHLIKNLIQEALTKKVLTSKNWLLFEHDPKSLTELRTFCHQNNLKLTPINAYASLVHQTEAKIRL